MADEWLGYNTVADLWGLLQPAYQGKTTWDETTPHTLDWITRTNNGIYYQIRSRLKAAGIDPDELTAEDIKTLGPINNLWAGGIIDPSKAVIKTERGEVWDRRYKDMLDAFADTKGRQAALSGDSQAGSNLFGSFGIASTAELDTDDLDPYFKKEDEY